jgi:tetratricopeptide (TPR) repeat protein
MLFAPFGSRLGSCMKILILAFLFVMLTANQARAAGEEAFDQGLKELAAKNWDKSLDLLETALTADPDNLRYGSEYRRAALLRAQDIHGKEGKAEDFDRPIKFFERLVSANPSDANAYLNYGLAYVDKVPVSDVFSRVGVANAALTQLSKSIELRPSYVGYYSRGINYLFWPRFFDRAKLGVADLETAVKMQKAGPKKPYYVHAWVALGDGYWKTDQLEKARSTWSEALKEFPDTPALQERLSKQGDELKALIQDSLDFKKRVDTNLKNLWLYP